MILLATVDLTVTRTYKNASDDVLRVDFISLVQKRDNILSIMNPCGYFVPTYNRNVSVNNHHSAASRTVASIEISTSADTVETISGDYLYAHWTNVNQDSDGNDIPIICNMSDLPAVGDSV